MYDTWGSRNETVVGDEWDLCMDTRFVNRIRATEAEGCLKESSIHPPQTAAYALLKLPALLFVTTRLRALILSLSTPTGYGT